MSSASISRKFSAIRSYFTFLMSLDVVVKNPVVGIKLPRIQHRVKDWLTDDEVLKILKSIPNTKRGYRDKAIVMLLLYNGLRRDEVCKLLFSDITKNQDGISITIKGKGNKIRIRPLHTECIKAIKDFLRVTDRTKEVSDKSLFLTRRGAKMQGQDILRIIKHYMILSNINKNIYPHMFRSKFASMAFESGVPITSVQEDMGHTSIETTAMYDSSKKSFSRSSVLHIKTITNPTGPIANQGPQTPLRTRGRKNHGNTEGKKNE